MTTAEQPVPRPKTLREYLRLLAAGTLINLAGQPLQSSPCRWCSDTTVGETCPMSVPCPACLAIPGRRCRRPSGHDPFSASRVHDSRVAAAVRRDEEREQAGDPTLPARWPTTTELGRNGCWPAAPSPQLALF